MPKDASCLRYLCKKTQNMRTEISIAVASCAVYNLWYIISEQITIWITMKRFYRDALFSIHALCNIIDLAAVRIRRGESCHTGLNCFEQFCMHPWL